MNVRTLFWLMDVKSNNVIKMDIKNVIKNGYKNGYKNVIKK